MCEGDIYAFAVQMYDRVEAGCRHVVIEQVFESVAADYAASVVEDGEPGVEVGVIAEHVGDKLGVKPEVRKEFGIGCEVDIGAVLLGSISFAVFDEFSAVEDGFVHTTIAEASCYEAAAECVDGFQTYAVHADGGGEDGRVVLSAGVQLRDSVDQFAEGNAAAVVAHFCRAVVGDVHLDAFAEALVKFVDTIIYGLLE